MVTPETCSWEETEDGQWVTSCRREWEFTHDGPVENGVRFCFHCGRSVEAKAWTEEEVEP